MGMAWLRGGGWLLPRLADGDWRRRSLTAALSFDEGRSIFDGLDEDLGLSRGDLGGTPLRVDLLVLDLGGGGGGGRLRLDDRGGGISTSVDGSVGSSVSSSSGRLDRRLDAPFPSLVGAPFLADAPRRPRRRKAAGRAILPGIALPYAPPAA